MKVEILESYLEKVLKEKRKNEKKRDYIGASSLGGACARQIQMEYISDDTEDFSAKTLRIFELGNKIEEMVRDELIASGFYLECEFSRTNPERKLSFSCAGGLVRGHVDGIIYGHSGEEFEDFKFPFIWECKSVNSKNWVRLKKHGAKKAFPKYAAQGALYQAYMEMTENPVLFTFVNKDNCEIHYEFVDFDCELAQEVSDKAYYIVKNTNSGNLMPKISDDPENFNCRFCRFKDKCFD